MGNCSRASGFQNPDRQGVFRYRCSRRTVRVDSGWLDSLLPLALFVLSATGEASEWTSPPLSLGLRLSGIGRERQKSSSLHEPKNGRSAATSPSLANVYGRLHIYPRLRGHRVGRIIACIDTLLSKEAKKVNIGKWKRRVQTETRDSNVLGPMPRNALVCLKIRTLESGAEEGKRRLIVSSILDLSFL